MLALQARDVSVGYDGHPVVRGLDLEIAPGQVVALLGPNGAGKTTSLLALAGVLSLLGGQVLRDGTRVGTPLHKRARAGFSLVTEERSVFMDLTTAENLRVGRCDVSLALALFPELEGLMRRRAGLLSGGEQQMLTLARALARRPRLLFADELSLGLAPLVVRRLLTAVRSAADDEGVAVLLVEQHVTQALKIADYAHVLQRGRVALHGAPTVVGPRLKEGYVLPEERASRNGHGAFVS